MTDTVLKATEAAVSCTGVTLTTKKKRILSNVSFDVPTGTITGLLGPNGAGKSSLMRMMAGLSRPTEGSITILGKPAGESMLGHLSFLPDRGQLPRWLTAAQWLSFGRGISPDWDEEQCERLIGE